jgi:integrase
LTEAINLTAVEPQKNGLAGATPYSSDINGKIMDYLWLLKKKGREELTIDHVGRRLRQLVAKGLNLLDPEEIKGFLAKQDKWSNRTKAIDVCVYDGFLKFLGISWDPPEYKAERVLPYVPTEEEIDQLISASGKKTSVFLQVLKETGARYGEAARLKWTDIDLKRRQITVGAEKHGDARILPISEKLIGMLEIVPKTSDRVFPSTKSAISSNFYLQRRKIARKLANPRLLKVGFHSFRHWKATNARHNGLDAFDIQVLLGHRDLKSTMRYVKLEKQVYQRSGNETFHVRTAKTLEEASKLVEVGFEFVHEC